MLRKSLPHFLLEISTHATQTLHVTSFIAGKGASSVTRFQRSPGNKLEVVETVMDFRPTSKEKEQLSEPISMTPPETSDDEGSLLVTKVNWHVLV